MAAPRITTVMINSEQASRAVAFWCGFLETEPAAEEMGITWLKPEGA